MNKVLIRLPVEPLNPAARIYIPEASVWIRTGLPTEAHPDVIAISGQFVDPL